MKCNFETDTDEDLLLKELNTALKESPEEIEEEALPDDIPIRDDGQDDEYLLVQEALQALESDYQERIEHQTIRRNTDGSLSYQSGNRKKIDETRFLTNAEKKAYSEEHYKLIHHMAHKYYDNHSLLDEYDEFFGEASFGFTKALNTYDIGEKIPFVNYACFCMDNVLRTYCQRLKKVTNPDIAMSFDDDIGGDSDVGKIGDIYVDESQESVEEIIERTCENEELQVLFAKMTQYLNPTQNFVVCSLYGINGQEELNKNQISKELHIPIRKINEITKSAFEVIRENMRFVI